MNRTVAGKLAKCYQNFAKEYNKFKLLDFHNIDGIAVKV